MGTFKLPDLGEGLAEAEIVAWHVQVGDQVRIDQPMVSVETAKAVVEVPAPHGGTVTKLHGAAGDIIATGAPLIDFDAGTVVGSMPAMLEDAVPHGTAAGLAPARDAMAKVRAVPAARAVARRFEVDLATVTGSGRDGVITLDDVLAQTRTAAPGASVAGDGAQALRGLRRAMAHSMSQSRDQIAASTVCDDADLHAWHTPGDYMLRLMRAMAAGWRIEPALNAWYEPRNVARTLQPHIDLAIAVDTPDGLIVPVLRGIETMDAATMRTALAAGKQAAHRRQTAAEDLRDFTLMLSNFGTLAGRYGIPLVVPPAVAILGAGKVRDDAVVYQGRVQAHRRMPLSLSFDHRCVTGGEACRYLAAVIADLELPD
jgi:2-oxoisovalerate dehydrogenase E2 component (dihydrolipoyl transacylase)